MPPHGGHGHHGGGAGRRGSGGWGWGGYPVVDGGDTTIVVGAPGCVTYDPFGRPIGVPCAAPLADDEAPGSDPDEDGDSPETGAEMIPGGFAPVTRTAINVANGRRRGGSTPYYQFAAQARSYPFDWNGGVPTGPRAAETRELAGADLLESGLNPYAQHYAPLQHRGFRLRPVAPSAFAGVLDGLSNNEQTLVKVGAVAAAAYLLWKHGGRRRRGR